MPQGVSTQELGGLKGISQIHPKLSCRLPGCVAQLTSRETEAQDVSWYLIAPQAARKECLQRKAIGHISVLTSAVCFIGPVPAIVITITHPGETNAHP